MGETWHPERDSDFLFRTSSGTCLDLSSTEATEFTNDTKLFSVGKITAVLEESWGGFHDTEWLGNKTDGLSSTSANAAREKLS